MATAVIITCDYIATGRSIVVDESTAKESTLLGKHHAVLSITEQHDSIQLPLPVSNAHPTAGSEVGPSPPCVASPVLTTTEISEGPVTAIDIALPEGLTTAGCCTYLQKNLRMRPFHITAPSSNGGLGIGPKRLTRKPSRSSGTDEFLHSKEAATSKDNRQQAQFSLPRFRIL